MEEQERIIDKRKVLADLKADLQSASVLKRQVDSKIEEWKDAYDGKPYGNEVSGKSAIVSQDIKRQGEWQHAALVDPFVSTSDVIKCHPITFEDVAAAKQNEILLNTQFCRKFDRFNFISKAVRVLDKEGTVIVQTGWDYEDEEIKVTREVLVQDEYGVPSIALKEVTERKVIKNQPTAKICRNEDVYIDPTCMDNIDLAQFIIFRYETDMSTLRKDGRYGNLSKLSKGSDGMTEDYTPEDDTEFKFKDEPRKKVLVYEYWGNYDLDGDGIAEPIVCAWTDDIILRMSTNPYPDGKPPFLLVPFNAVPFKAHGEANAELIGDNQKVKTAILRGMIDNMAQSNNAQVGMRKGALDPTNRSRFIKGRNFEFNGATSDFWQGSYNAIPSSVFNMIDLMNNEIESMSGTKSFSGGITGTSIGSGSATAARGALDASALRRMHVVRNIAENLIKPLMRKWIAYNAEFLEEEEIVRVTNEQYVPIRKDDLNGSIDIDISVATAEDNSAKAQELSFLLQTLGPSEDPTIRKMLMADILELMRMPDKAKILREYEPEPDETQQKAEQLELQNLEYKNLLLEAQIATEHEKLEIAKYDKELTKSKAMTELAKSRKLISESDLNDLAFMMKDEEVENTNLVDQLERKRLHELDVMAFQAQYGDKNIGVSRS